MEDSIKRFSFRYMNCSLTLFCFCFMWTCHGLALINKRCFSVFCVYYTGSIRFYFYIFSLHLLVDLCNFHWIKISTNSFKRYNSESCIWYVGLVLCRWQVVVIHKRNTVAMLSCKDPKHFDNFSCDDNFQGNNESLRISKVSWKFRFRTIYNFAVTLLFS